MAKKLITVASVTRSISRNYCFYNTHYFKHKDFAMIHAIIKIDYLQEIVYEKQIKLFF